MDVEFQEPLDIVDSAENQLPNIHDRLTGSFPNPFSPNTIERGSISKISFSLIEDSNVTIDVFNCKGQRVKTVVDDFYTSGSHSVQWDGTDDNSGTVSSGVYLYRLKTKNGEDVRKMMVIK